LRWRICDRDRDMSQRIEKIQKVAREVLGEAIQNLKDPRIGFVTVTTVRVSADLRHARVFVSVFGSDDERRATMAGLVSATPHLRAQLGHEMRIKYLPELTFELDTGPETAQRLEEIIRKIHEEEEER
jgi:ribosome-binding factor A